MIIAGSFREAHIPRADRLFGLVQLLSGSRSRSLAELTRALGASARSLYRDLADLEARGVAIERAGGRYRLMESKEAKAMPLTSGERLLLTLALENPAIEKQAANADMVARLRWRFSHEAPRCLALAGPERTGEVGDRVTQALREAAALAHSVSILYTSLSSGRSWRGLDPWVVVHRTDAWYVIGRCHVHDEPRTFRLDRIGAVLPIGSSFERPDTFDVKAWFLGSWGVTRGTGSHEVTILFEERVAALIEHANHHATESKFRRVDGKLEYHVSVSSLDEIARWIVTFGGLARAIAPAALVAEVVRIASGAAAAHRTARAAAMVRRGKRALTDSDTGRG